MVFIYLSNCSFWSKEIMVRVKGIIVLENTNKEGYIPVFFLFLYHFNYFLYFFESYCLEVQYKIGGKFHLKLNITQRPIAKKYCEGKMKRTLKREWKSTWNC